MITPCIEDLQCPRCGHQGSFNLTMSVTVVVSEAAEPYVEGDGAWDNESEIICPACEHEETVQEFSTEFWDVSLSHPAKLYEVLYYTCPTGTASGWYRVTDAGNHDPATPYEDTVITLAVWANPIIEASASQLTRFNTQKITRPSQAAA